MEQFIWYLQFGVNMLFLYALVGEYRSPWKHHHMSNKLLIVEDEIDVRDMLRIALEDLYVDLDFAETYKEAKSRLLKNEYLLLIVDVVLPDGNGIELIQSLLSHLNQVRPPATIFITGKPQDHFRLQSLDVQAIDFVEKPLNINEFRKKVINILRLMNNFRNFEETNTLTPEKKIYLKIVNICEDQIENQNFNLGQASVEIGVGTRTIQRLLKEEFNTSFSTVLNEVKMRRASLLLKKGYKAKEVSRLCGYRHNSNFTTAFRTHFGSSPIEYLKNDKPYSTGE